METNFWNKEIEMMPLDRLKSLQEKRLREVVQWAYDNTELYRRKYDQAGVKPADIKTLEDITTLPLTTYKDDFCETSMDEKLAVPREKVKVFYSTSGTLSGSCQPVMWTREDFDEILGQGEIRLRKALGMTEDDIIQALAGDYCCFKGCELIGAGLVTVMAGRGNLDYQIKFAQEVGVTVLQHLPSLMLMYFERAAQLGIDIKESKLRMVLTFGETLAESYRKKIEEKYNVSIRCIYSCAEIPFVAYECLERGGMHIFGDWCIVEVVDPKTGEVLGPGEEGEIVATALVNKAMPLIRYRMGDVGSMLPYELCPCGRTHPKISAIKGRVVHIINIDGKKIMPIDVEEMVASTEGLGDEYQIIMTESGKHDKLKVKAEHRPEVEDLRALKNRFEQALTKNLGVESEVELVPMGTLGRPLFKAQRVITV
ncbi:MAG: AMP-binding protein [Thermodesulfobacteriota bacterium]|nr:AMP-binding protein [Thermodesulfobacteriota bacterium]